MATPESGNKVRIVLIGKTGAGKSSLGNTIMGDKIFKPVVGWDSGTVKTNWAEVMRDGRCIQVTDTPGVCDTRRKPKDVYMEIGKSMTTAAPGPHAVIMVLKASDRFTEEEGKAYDELKGLFKGFEDFLIVVFTRIDELEDDDLDLDGQLKAAPPKVGKIIEDAGGRYLGIKNKTGWSERRQEGNKLMDEVYKLMKKNGGKHYSNKLLKKITDKVDEEASTRHVSTDVIRKEVAEEKNPSFLEKIKIILRDYVFKYLCTIL